MSCFVLLYESMLSIFLKGSKLRVSLFVFLFESSLSRVPRDTEVFSWYYINMDSIWLENQKVKLLAI
jgi:hypothetical protein